MYNLLEKNMPNLKVTIAKEFCSLYNLKFQMSDATHDSTEHGVAQFVPEMHEILVALQAAYPELRLYDADTKFIPPSNEGEGISFVVQAAYNGLSPFVQANFPQEVDLAKAIVALPEGTLVR